MSILPFLAFDDLFCFFAVLVRTSVFFVILPFLGDRVVPMPVKILLSLAISIVMYPILVASGSISPSEAIVWSQSASGIVSTISLEIFLALAIGFSARMIFMAIQIGGDIIGNFMGFSAASQYDPDQESQTQVVSKVISTLAMLLFVTIDGHHLMLEAMIRSYEIVGIGDVSISGGFSERLMTFSGEMIRMGLQLAAPMAVSLFVINVIYGVFAKALPQMNILVLSLSVSALVGFFVLWISLPEIQSSSKSLVARVGDEMGVTLESLKGP